MSRSAKTLFPAVYRTADVSRLGPTLRQLQWWDEHKYVQPKAKRRQRLYSAIEATLALIIHELRRKSISQRRLLHMDHSTIRRAIAHVLRTGDESYLLVNRKCDLSIQSDPAAMIEHLAKSPAGYVLLSLRDCVARVRALA